MQTSATICFWCARDSPRPPARQTTGYTEAQSLSRRQKSMTPTRQEKFKAFQALHERSGAFVIPNPWDPGSAKILPALGFEALATTSSGFAFSKCRLDPPPGVPRKPLFQYAQQHDDAQSL